MQTGRLPKIAILATGGTIAGVGTEGTSVGYQSGQLSVDDLLAAAPRVGEIAEIVAHQVCNVNSDDMTAPIWLELARMIERMAFDEGVDGFVVSHGTDTMDETAYLLTLVLKTDKPVVLTGSMRPSTATSADGPMNLYQAVAVAAHPDSRGKGVQVAFSGSIYNARSVQKTSTHSLVSMSGGEAGCAGVVRDDHVFYFHTSTKLHTVYTEFRVGTLEDLPRVNVLYFNVDADPALIEAAAKISDGLVIAAAGGGEFSKRFAEVIAKVEIPVVVSSRVGSGGIMAKTLVCPNAIPANDLPPQKAAVLLRLALTKTHDQQMIARMFEVY